MSRVQVKDYFPSQHKSLEQRVAVLERMLRTQIMTPINDVNTTGLTNAQIDEKAFGIGAEASVNPIVQDGKTVSDSTNQLVRMRVNGEWRPLTSPLVSALPASPVDGQTVCFQTTAMAEQGVVWTLRYRAASTSTHKWEMVGGSDLERQEGEGVFTSAATAYEWKSTGLIPVVLPLAGVYDVFVTVNVLNETSECNNYICPDCGGTIGGAPMMSILPVGKIAPLAANARISGAAGAETTIAVTTSTGSQKLKLYYPTVRVRPVRLG